MHVATDLIINSMAEIQYGVANVKRAWHFSYALRTRVDGAIFVGRGVEPLNEVNGESPDVLSTLSEQTGKILF